MYQKFVRCIDMVNVIISQYELPQMGDLYLLPQKGNVAFGTGKDQWGFSLTRFA
jgi:elongation factor 2